MRPISLESIISIFHNGCDGGRTILFQLKNGFSDWILPLSLSRRSDQVPQGTLACSGTTREWAKLSQNDEIDVVVFDPSTEGSQYFLQKMSLEVDLNARGKKVTEAFDASEMGASFLKVRSLPLPFPSPDRNG